MKKTTMAKDQYFEQDPSKSKGAPFEVNATATWLHQQHDLLA
jgi:hypothetical protein